MDKILEIICAIILTIYPTDYKVVARHQDLKIASPKVKKLMKYHGILFVNWNWEKMEYGFYKKERWCPLIPKKEEK